MIPDFPERLSLAHLPTPMRPLNRISAQLQGPKIWLKCDDLSGSLLSGNKIRKLEFLAADALRQGCNTLITCGGLQSNHCRATAVTAAQLGMQCHLILRGQTDQKESCGLDGLLKLPANKYGLDGNLLLDQLCGAAISVLPPKHYFSHLDEEFGQLASEYKRRGDKAYLIPTGGSNAMGLWGYIAAAREMAKDFTLHSIDPEIVVCATGSGGTQAGLTLGFELLDKELQVVGMAVCDSEAYFTKKITQDLALWQQQFVSQDADFSAKLSLSTLDDYIGPGYAIGYPEVFECIRWLAQEEGVVLDPVYTGKAFYGLTKEIESGRWQGMSDIVFVHTGGIFGLYPYRQELMKVHEL